MRIPKSFKLEEITLEMIKEIQKENEKINVKDTQTAVIEQAVYHYYASVFGNDKLAAKLLKR